MENFVSAIKRACFLTVGRLAFIVITLFLLILTLVRSTWNGLVIILQGFVGKYDGVIETMVFGTAEEFEEEINKIIS